MASARHIADEIAMIFEGKIIWRGAADDVDSSGNAYVEQFVNGSADGPINVMGGWKTDRYWHRPHPELVEGQVRD